MTKLVCKLVSHSISFHLQQLYTGYYILYKRGLIDIKQQIIKETRFNENCPQHLKDARNAHLRVELSNGLKLHYDTHDSYEIDEEYLSESDLYFKRSYLNSHLVEYGKSAEKVYPLGLYYRVYPSTIDKFAIQRNISLAHTLTTKLKIDYFINTFDKINLVGFTPTTRIMESLPILNQKPKLIFMARAYNPYSDSERSNEKVEERVNINKMRADCIDLLRREFGPEFYGGFIHTEFAAKNYKSLLLPTKTVSNKRNYIALLRSYPIGVATTGLHGSIGGKFAEYVAFSKAILSERLNYEVPGDLQEGKNYLAFRTPEECVQKARLLFENAELRNYVMVNNAVYYQNYLRPDMIVLNSILKSMSLNNELLKLVN